MSGRQYGFLNRSGFPGRNLFAMPIDVLTTGEKQPVPGLLPAGLIIFHTFVQIFVAEATATTKTIDVGLLSTATSPDADADGLLDGAVTSAAGVVRGTMDDTTAQTIGALLRELTTAHAGPLVPHPHVITKTDTAFTYTLGSAHTELVGDVYVDCMSLPVPNA